MSNGFSQVRARGAVLVTYRVSIGISSFKFVVIVSTQVVGALWLSLRFRSRFPSRVCRLFRFHGSALYGAPWDSGWKGQG